MENLTINKTKYQTKQNETLNDIKKLLKLKGYQNDLDIVIKEIAEKKESLKSLLDEDKIFTVRVILDQLNKLILKKDSLQMRISIYYRKYVNN